MPRTPLMAGNWKMNLNHVEAVGFVQKLAWTLEDKKHDATRSEVVVLPPFVDDDTPLPSYLDAQLKGTWGHPDYTGRIQPMLFLAYDYLNAIEEKEDREDESSISSFFIRVAAPYDRRWGRLSLRIVPWFGVNQLHFTSRVSDVVEKFVRPVYPGGLRTELARTTSWGPAPPATSCGRPASRAPAR